MALTKRKDILDQVIYGLEGLASITTVTRWRDTDADPFSADECPALNIRDRTANIDHQTSYDEHALPVEIDLYTTSAIIADEVEAILGDVAERIALNETWGGYADGTNIESHGIDINQSGDVISSGAIEITINYTTDKGRI